MSVKIFFIHDTYSLFLKKTFYIFIAIEQPGYAFDDLTHVLSIYRITFYIYKKNPLYTITSYIIMETSLNNDASSVRGKTGRITWLIQPENSRMIHDISY